MATLRIVLRLFLLVGLLGWNKFLEAQSPSKDTTLLKDSTILDSTGQKSTQQLKAVEITGRRAVVSSKGDRLVFQVDRSINATGLNVLELLKQVPGVVVNQEERIVLNGKSGTLIQINGRNTPLNGSDLTAFLKGINAAEIESIEVVSNPSAQYDASGNGGIINIVLKKNSTEGWNGSAQGGMAYGSFGKYNAGSSFNYRKNQWNVFGNLSGQSNRNESTLNLFRFQADSIYDQQSRGVFFNQNTTLRLGVDYTLNKNTTVGILVNTSDGLGSGKNNSVTPIRAQNSNQIFRNLEAASFSSSKRKQWQANANIKSVDSLGNSWTADIDLGDYNLYSTARVPNVYTNGMGQVEANYTFETITPTSIKLLALQADRVWKMIKKKNAPTLQFGSKYSHVNTFNQFDFFESFEKDTQAGPLPKNQERSNAFRYEEQILAGYTQIKTAVKKWSFQAGLRAEWTHSRGILTTASALQNANDRDVKRSYLNVFPSASIGFSPKQEHQLKLSYSRRIDRPGYQDLNPFENKLDELTYQKGNPFLQPQYTQYFELQSIFKYRFISTLSFSDVNNFFAQITDTIEGNRNFIQQRNIASQKIYSLNFSLPFNATPWWSVYANISLNHTRYNEFFEENKFIRLNATGFTIYQQHSFSFGKGWAGELSSFFSSPYIWAGTYETNALGGVDLGIQKKILRERLTIRGTLTDISRTYPWRGVSRLGSLEIRGNGGWESRQLRLNATWNWGKSKVKSARNRTTGLEDLQNRVR